MAHAGRERSPSSKKGWVWGLGFRGLLGFRGVGLRGLGFRRVGFKFRGLGLRVRSL